MRKKDDSYLKEIRSGSVSVNVYRDKDGGYTVVWH